jgi:hypothetical protein
LRENLVRTPARFTRPADEAIELERASPAGALQAQLRSQGHERRDGVGARSRVDNVATDRGTVANDGSGDGRRTFGNGAPWTRKCPARGESAHGCEAANVHAATRQRLDLVQAIRTAQREQQSWSELAALHPQEQVGSPGQDTRLVTRFRQPCTDFGEPARGFEFEAW